MIGNCFNKNPQVIKPFFRLSLFSYLHEQKVLVKEVLRFLFS